jgi:hypothetical protein
MYLSSWCAIRLQQVVIGKNSEAHARSFSRVLAHFPANGLFAGPTGPCESCIC